MPKNDQNFETKNSNSMDFISKGKPITPSIN